MPEIHQPTFVISVFGGEAEGVGVVVGQGSDFGGRSEAVVLVGGLKRLGTINQPDHVALQVIGRPIGMLAIPTGDQQKAFKAAGSRQA